MPGSEQRFYRYHHRKDKEFVTFQVRYRETDLWIRAAQDCQDLARDAVLNCRHQLQKYIDAHPEFLHSLTPLPDDPKAPALIRRMLDAAQKTDVGPMAAVAGAIAQKVAEHLRSVSACTIVENGGDCYLDVDRDIVVGIYPGARSPFKDRLGLHLNADQFPLAICTSSATIGHSLSLGRADAVTILAKDGALADAAATAIGNIIRCPGDIERALETAINLGELDGILVVIEDKFAAWGNVELVPPD